MKKPKDFERMKFYREHADEIKARIDGDHWGPYIEFEGTFGLKVAKDFHKWLTRAIAYMEEEAEDSGGSG